MEGWEIFIGGGGGAGTARKLKAEMGKLKERCPRAGTARFLLFCSLFFVLFATRAPGRHAGRFWKPLFLGGFHHHVVRKTDAFGAARLAKCDYILFWLVLFHCFLFTSSFGWLPTEYRGTESKSEGTKKPPLPERGCGGNGTRPWKWARQSFLPSSCLLRDSLLAP